MVDTFDRCCYRDESERDHDLWHRAFVTGYLSRLVSLVLPLWLRAVAGSSIAILMLLVVVPRADAATPTMSLPDSTWPKAGFVAHLRPISGAAAIVARGEFGDSATASHWTAVAYIAKALVKSPKRSVARGDVACITTLLGKVQRLGTVCGSLQRLSQPAHATPGTALLTYGEEQLGFLTGAVAPSVARVVLVLKSGPRVPVTLKTVSEITGRIRFFALQYQVKEIKSIALYDARGNLLENETIGPKPRPKR